MTVDYQNRSLLSVDMPSWAYTSNGVQLLADGDMEAAGVAAWTAFQSVLSKSLVNPHAGLQSLQVAFNGAAQGAARQIVMTIGRTYRLTGWARGDGTAIPDVGTGAANLWVGTSSVNWQYFDLTFVTGAADVWFYCNNLAAGRSVGFDDVRLEWLPASTRNLGTLGGTVQLGDGVTPATFPTQVFPHGMSFDGGDYLLRADEAALSFTSGGGVDLSFSLEFFGSFGVSAAAMVAKGSWLASNEYVLFVSGNIAYVACFDAALAYIGRSGAAGTPGRSPTAAHYVGTYDGTKTSAGFVLYRDSIRVDTANYAGGGVYAGMSDLGQPVRFGSLPGGVAFTGISYNYAIYPFALQPGEVAGLYRQRLGLLNRGA